MVERVANINGVVGTDANPVGAVHRGFGDEVGAAADHRLAGGGMAIDGRLLFTVAGNRLDDSRLSIHFSDAVVGDVGDVDVVLRVERDTVRRTELGFRRGVAVAAKTL